MTEKELKKLSRADLLEMLIAQSKEVKQLQEQLEEAEKKSSDRQIELDKAGSIAEAALQINGVFDAAQAAAQQYLENIQQLEQRQETICAQMEQESREKASQLLEETEKKCSSKEMETKIKCMEMLEKAKAESQSYWDEVSARLEAFYQEHAGLRELLSIALPKKE